MDWASINWTYVVIIALCLLLFVLFAILFFIAERWGGGKSSSAKKEPEKPKQEKKPDEVVKIVVEEKAKVDVDEEKVARDKELNNTNLANDIQKLITVNETKKQQEPERVFRSRLSNTGRMRQYYDNKHRGRDATGVDGDIYDMASRDSGDGIKLTADDMKRLMALQQIIEKKSEEWDSELI